VAAADTAACASFIRSWLPCTCIAAIDAATKRRAIVEEFEKAMASAKEGLMIKQSNTPYENARSKAWIKVSFTVDCADSDAGC